MSTTVESQMGPFSEAQQHAPRASRGPILVATTGDDGSAALDIAGRLAERDGRAVAVVSAVELPPAVSGFEGVPPLVPDVPLYTDGQRARVARQIAALGTAARDWPVDVVVDEPSHAIAGAARARHASLVVLGTGRHDLAARLLGEVALRAVRRSPCPVLAVPTRPFDAADLVPARAVVVATDFSPTSVLAARAALDFVAPGGTLHLVHVWQRHVIETTRTFAQDDAYERSLPARFARVERALLDRARDLTILPTSLLGDPVEQLAAFARSHDAALIAAGRKGHRLLEVLFVGRVTTGLLREARCAVLVTPEPALAERDALERALSGTSESRARAEWGELLDLFTRRNAGRRTRLEVDDPDIGAQTAEIGWALTGAAYDHHDHRVTLMLGAPGSPTTHLTRAITGVTSVAINTDADDRDLALRITHGTGQTLLTFVA